MKKIIYFISVFILIACESNNTNDTSTQSPEATTQDGQGGSLAKFTLKGKYLYTVDERNLSVFNIENEKDPIKVNSENIGFNIETLFGYKNYLYIGSQNGMFIYDIKNPEFPKQLASVNHFTACDPVVANDKYAFVTLHSETFCGNNINVLEVYDITKITEPILINSRNLTFPRGLGLFGDYLIVCDDEIKIFDVSNPKDSKLVNSVNRSAFDVIIQNDLLIVIGETGLFQYRLTKNEEKGIELEELSAINF